jgi:Domain of unknown function (DUF4232)
VKVRIALAGLAGLAMLAGAGVATAASASASTTTAPAAVRTLPGFPASPLSAKLSLSQVKGHERTYVLTLTNVSHRVLTVSGYPGLRLLNGRMQPLPTKTVPVMHAFPVPGKVVLFPGRSATAKISLSVYSRPWGWYPRGMSFFGAKAAFLQVTLPSVALPGGPGQTHRWMPAQHFTLQIPGGSVQVVQNRLYETALAGQMPVFPR